MRADEPRCARCRDGSPGAGDGSPGAGGARPGAGGARPPAAGRGVAARLLILAAAYVVAGSPSGARADVPVSAEARALSISPELLEGPALMFDLPSRALREPSSLVALGTRSFSGTDGVSLILRHRGVAFFTTSQMPLSSREASIGADRELQGGLALGGFGLDAAVSVRVRAELLTTDFVSETDTQIREESSASKDELVEIVGGLGTGDRNRVDVAVALGRPNNHSERSREIRSGNDREFFVVTVDDADEPWYRASVHAAFDVGRDARFVVAGEWGSRERDFELHRLDILVDEGVQIERLEQTRAVERYGDRWFAGVAFSTRTEFLDVLRIAAGYRSLRLPEFDDVRPATTVRRTAALSASAERVLFDWLTAMAGIEKTHTLNRESSTYLFTDTTESRVTERETLADRFSIGSRLRWKRVEAVGAMSTTLDLGSLFTYLDLRISL